MERRPAWAWTPRLQRYLRSSWPIRSPASSLRRGMIPMTPDLFDAAAGARIEECPPPRSWPWGSAVSHFFRMRSSMEAQVPGSERRTSRCPTSPGKPMVVHVRDAWPDVLRVLDEAWAERVVIDCFSGDAATLASAPSAATGCASPATSRTRRTSICAQRPRAVPIDRFLVETDAPFLVLQSATRSATTSRRTSPHVLPRSPAFGTKTRRSCAEATSGNAERRSPGSGRPPPNTRSELKVAVRLRVC